MPSWGHPRPALRAEAKSKYRMPLIPCPQSTANIHLSRQTTRTGLRIAGDLPAAGQRLGKTPPYYYLINNPQYCAYSYISYIKSKQVQALLLSPLPPQEKSYLRIWITNNTRMTRGSKKLMELALFAI